MRTLTNTVSVLIATLFTIVAVYFAVEGLGSIPAIDSAASTIASSGATTSGNYSIGSTTQTCPRTGCTASSCHATSGSATPTTGDSGQMPQRSARGNTY